MECLADYIHRVTKLESEGKILRAKPTANPAEQNAGRDCSGERDSGRDRQDSGPHRPAIRQAER